jgi:hypothetical protein
MMWQKEALHQWWGELKLLQNGDPLPQDLKTARDAIERLNKEIEDENRRTEMADHEPSGRGQ